MGTGSQNPPPIKLRRPGGGSQSTGTDGEGSTAPIGAGDGSIQLGAGTIPQTPASSAEVDYVAILATTGLTIVACVAMYLHDPQVAGTAVGAIAGYMMRLYR